MSFLRPVIEAAATYTANASLENGVAENTTFRGGDGDDYIKVNGNCNCLFGDAGDDTIIAKGNNDELYGGDGADTLDFTGNNSIVSGGLGNDDISVEGDNNLIEDNGGDNTIFSYGEDNEMQLSNGNQDIVAIGTDTLINTGDGKHSVFTAGVRNKVVLGNNDNGSTIIHHGDIDLSGASKHKKIFFETLTELARKVEIDKKGYTEEEYALYKKYEVYTDLIAAYENSFAANA